MRVRFALLAALVIAAVAAVVLLGGGEPESEPGIPRVATPRPEPASSRSAHDREYSTANAPRREGKPDRRGLTELRGVVNEVHTRKPVAGARVRFEGEGVWPEVRTDEAGEFRVRGPSRHPRGEGLRIEAPGFLATVAPYYIAQEGHMRVWLRPILHRVPGRVVDSEGRPVPGVSVRIADMDLPFVTDRDGRFGPVPIGEHDVRYAAWSDRHPLTRGEFEYDDRPPPELRIILSPGDAVKGLVVREDGSPVPRALVYLSNSRNTVRVRTGPDGRFALLLPVGAMVWIDAVAEGLFARRKVFAGAPVRIVLEPGHEPLPVRAPPPPPPPRPKVAGELGVRVVDHLDRPIAGAYLNARALSESRVWTARTGGDGAGRFPIPAGVPVELEVSCPRADPVVVETYVAEGATVDLGRIVLRPKPAPPRQPRPPRPPPPHPGIVTGRVVDAEGRPVPGLTVDAGDEEIEDTDSFGRFRIEAGYRTPNVEVTVRPPGSPPVTALATVDGPGVELRLPARGAIRMRLRGKRESDCKPELSVWADSRLGSPYLETDDVPFLVDEVGSVRIDCPAGVHQLSFRMEPGEWAFYPDVVVVKGRETELEYAFPRFATLTVIVLGPDGKPIPDASVLIARTDGWLGETNREGKLVRPPKISDVHEPAGRFRLRIQASGLAATLTEPVDLTRDSEMTVRMSRGAAIRGVLTDRAGRPIDGDVSWAPALGPFLYPTATEPDGSFELEGRVPAGPIRLHAEGLDHRPVELTITAREGETTEVRIRLGP